MDPNTNQLLRDILEKTEENSRLLHKMHRSMMWGKAFRFSTSLLLSAVLSSILLFESVFADAFDTYQTLLTGVDKINTTAGQAPDIGALLKKVRVLK